jgi:malate synthase
LWQWLHHGELAFPDDAPINFALFDHAVAVHTHKLRNSQHPGACRADEAATLLVTMTYADQLGDFLTLPAYEQLA